MAGCDILNDRSDFRYAVVKTIPVFFSYLFVGVAYGMTLKEAGYGWPWALLASSAVYAGSLQFALTAFMASGADLLTVALTTLFVNSRHIFYGLSYTRSLRKTGRWYPYLIFALTDETYSLYCSSVSDLLLTPAAMRQLEDTVKRELTARERSGMMEALAAAESLLRDALVVSEHVDEAMVNTDVAEVVERLAATSSTKGLLDALDAIAEARRDLERNATRVLRVARRLTGGR